MFRPEVTSHRAMLGAMKGLVLSSPSLPASGGELAWCSTPGRSILMTLEEAAGLKCGNCVLHAMLGARRAIDEGASLVELCLTVSDLQEEHAFCRVDGRFRDYAVEAGMPVRQVREFIAVRVWPV